MKLETAVWSLVPNRYLSAAGRLAPESWLERTPGRVHPQLKDSTTGLINGIGDKSRANGPSCA